MRDLSPRVGAKPAVDRGLIGDAFEDFRQRLTPSVDDRAMALRQRLVHEGAFTFVPLDLLTRGMAVRLALAERRLGTMMCDADWRRVDEMAARHSPFDIPSPDAEHFLVEGRSGPIRDFSFRGVPYVVAGAIVLKRDAAGRAWQFSSIPLPTPVANEVSLAFFSIEPGASERGLRAWSRPF